MAAKKGDSGHAINAVNVGKIVDELKSLGSLYQPPSTSLEATELEKEVEPSQDVVKAVAAPKEVFDNTTDLRKAQAEVMKGLLRNALGNLQATDGVTKEQVGRFKAHYKQFTGANVREQGRKKKKALAAAKAKADSSNSQETTEVPEVTEQQHSVSQQSYEKKVANSYDAVSILESITQYNPKDPKAATAYVRSEVDKFHALNRKVDADYKPYGAALKARDIQLYAPETGSVIKAKKVKSFISNTDAFSVSQKKTFINIKFTVPATKKLHL